MCLFTQYTIPNSRVLNEPKLSNFHMFGLFYHTSRFNILLDYQEMSFSLLKANVSIKCRLFSSLYFLSKAHSQSSLWCWYQNRKHFPLCLMVLFTFCFASSKPVQCLCYSPKTMFAIAYAP